MMARLHDLTSVASLWHEREINVNHKRSSIPNDEESEGENEDDDSIEMFLNLSLR